MQRSYTPPDEATRPDLTGPAGVAQAVEAGAVQLTAVYFDTVDSALLRAGVTLRRLSGGDDEGWHLHLPAGSAHDEVRLPLSRARKVPPKPMREAVTGWTRGTTLGAVATLATRRTHLDLLDQHGTVLARFADADIEGVRLADDEAEPVCWREWHFELVGGGTEAAYRRRQAAGSCPRRWRRIRKRAGARTRRTGAAASGASEAEEAAARAIGGAREDRRASGRTRSSGQRDPARAARGRAQGAAGVPPVVGSTGDVPAGA